MKNVSIFHGTGGTPESFWFPWLKDELERKGYKVWLPQLPETNNPDIKRWLPFALKIGMFNKDSILIGHSAGASLILSILENLNIKVRQVILVAVFFEQIEDKKEAILQPSYDWKKIRENVDDLTIINSDNDPWGCDDKVGKKLFNLVGGTLIIRHDGHFGSDTYKQEYPSFPLLLKLID